MKTVTVGSANPVKIAAVRSAVQRIWPQVWVSGIETASGVSEQPRSDEEAITGATNRACGALEYSDADFGFGLEGNTVDTPYGMFVSGWVAIVKRSDRERLTQVGLGTSGRLLLPERIATGIRNGEELGPLMDQFTGQENTKQRQGTVGILTDGHLDRTVGFERGVLYALSRFISPQYY